MVKQLMENVEKVKKTMSEENGNINKGIENLKKNLKADGALKECNN